MFVSFVFIEIAQVIRAHSSTGPEQLNLENGQLILILSKNASGWWLGELQVSVFFQRVDNHRWSMAQLICTPLTI